MSSNIRKSARCCKGFSLVEMMIGLTITMIVVGAFINLFINQSKSYNSESLREDMYLTGRIALDEIQREAMNAGTGLPGLFASVQVRDGGATEPDTITFLYVPQTSLHLLFATSPPPNANANSMKLSADSDIDSLVEGEQLMIYDESSFNIIEITSINTSSRTIVFVPPVGVNSPSGLAKAYNPATAVITRVTIMSITVDKSDADHPTLVKFRGGTSLGEVAYDIENMQTTIIFEDSDTASAANDADGDDTNDSMDLRALEVTLTARSSRPDPRYSENADHYYRQEFTSTIAPRNVIY
ncbi:MAG: hypothetical protein A3F83_13435 [Candidatus Glassbacteria bacterium RIFCSPLOWO2_12_FULL_58_11]|uniref:Prepilin-type N-terminal cleavage/methylation domain-containing protein n=1 Tax=Candidatus Glassbacteria bacterium RIFCSPLOWO2_12_FULL_58_11 TaxID=1817867 RepID=A0A1F5YMD6_9BACT|nr:MAG: hypothetical protein A3F83_13435 [Candidatus Glassbacteria bacterium RIFCSPLOWO2_12_FULL_58_11]